MWVFTVLKSLVVGGGGVMVEERRGEACRECRWCVGGRANMVYLSLFVSEGFLGCPLPPLPPNPPRCKMGVLSSFAWCRIEVATTTCEFFPIVSIKITYDIFRFFFANENSRLLCFNCICHCFEIKVLREKN